MKKLLFAGCLTALLPSFLSAQYDHILNDPDVIWAAEISLNLFLEPEYLDGFPDSLLTNLSVPLKLLNPTNGPVQPEQVMLAPKLLALLRDPSRPVYPSPDSLRPLSMVERLARISDSDTVKVLDIDTQLDKNVVVHNDLDPTSVKQVRVRQLLYYRASTAEFDVLTVGFAPLLWKEAGDLEPAHYRYIMPTGWFRMPPEKRRKTAAYPDLNSPDITWARRLKTQQRTDILLEDLRPFKDFKRPVMQQLLERMRRDPGYRVVSSDWQPLSPAEREGAIVKTDTVVTFDPETYEEKTVIERSELLGEDVKTLRLEEDWFWDERRKQLIIRLHAFAPMMESQDSEGNFRFMQPLFWREVGRKK